MLLLTELQLSPHVKYVMDKFRGKLPKEDLKRFAKEVSKKLVASDFKNRRVEDPTRISAKQERQVKKYVKDFFDKAVAKKADHDRRKVEKKDKASASSSTLLAPSATTDLSTPMAATQIGGADDIALSDNDPDDDDPDAGLHSSPESELKRKRDDSDGTPLTNISPLDGDDSSASKRGRYGTTPPPPPPPPPQSEYNNVAAAAPETGMTAGADISGSFVDEALEAVVGANSSNAFGRDSQAHAQGMHEGGNCAPGGGEGDGGAKS